MIERKGLLPEGIQRPLLGQELIDLDGLGLSGDSDLVQETHLKFVVDHLVGEFADHDGRAKGFVGPFETRAQVDIVPHHLIYGELRDVDLYNWMKKIEVSAGKVRSAYSDYPGGFDAFVNEFKNFFLDPRRFTYTPFIICTGIKA